MDKIGKSYMLQAVAMAHDMGLFKAAPHIKSNRMRRAREFTAWCLYIWDGMQSYYYRQEPLLSHPPDAPLPDVATDASWYGEIFVRYPLSDLPIPTQFGETAKAMMELRSLMHDMVLIYFSPSNQESGPSPRYASVFQLKLNDWFQRLPYGLSIDRIMLPSHIRTHLEYYSTLITLCQIHSGTGSSVPSNDEVMVRAYVNIETLVRLYYVRYSYDSYDAFMVMMFLLLVGNRSLDNLESASDPLSIEDLRASVMLCAKGLHDQGKNSHLFHIVYYVLRGRIQPRDRDLLLTHVKEGGGVDKEVLLQYNESQWPVPIIKINEDPRTALLQNLVKRYEDLSLDATSAPGTDRGTLEP